MPAGLIQLVSYGIQDLFLTGEPQITFFKVIYRRHTNFSIEPIEQFFNTNRAGFGQKISCTLSRSGDLVNKIYLVVDLPVIPPFIDNKRTGSSINRFAWVRKIGFAMLRVIEIEIGGQLIDRQYGEWLYIWDELTNNKKYTGFDKMIGNISDLTDFSNGKDTYRLYIPLQFWFCKFSNLSLPLVSLQYNEVKINIEFEQQQNCYLIGPTQYIQVSNSVVHFKQGEWIQQTVGSQVAIGLFMNFDVVTGRLYYIRATTQPFQSFNNTSVSGVVDVNVDQIRTQYSIVGLCNNFVATPVDDTSEVNIKIILPKLIEKLVIPRCFLDVEYIYLDTAERFRFINTAHEYLIEQVQLAGFRFIQAKQFQINLALNHPNKALFWVAQTDTATNINDRFNFTNSVVRDLTTDNLCGKNFVIMSQVILNSIPRFTQQPSTYFNWIQPYQYFSVDPDEGVNVYSFGLSPEMFQPTGTCNMSKMDLISLLAAVDPNAVTGTNAFIRVYGLGYNILRIINGLGGLLFSN
jgi:hypothetical protein